MVIKKLASIGNSYGVILDRYILRQVGIDSQTLIEVGLFERDTDFLEELLKDEEVRAALSEEDIRARFDLGYHTKHADTIFTRVFGRAS